MGGVVITAVFTGVVYGQTPGGQSPGRPALSAATAAQSPSPDKVVVKVGDAAITEGEIETFIQGLTPQAQNTLAHQGRRPLGDELVRILTLSQEALNHHLDSTPTFKELLAIHRREVLASLAYQEILRQCVVTPEETSKYFTEHQSEYDEIRVLQAVVRKKPEGAKEGTPGFTAEEANNRAEEIRKALIAGDDPKKVAEKYQVANIVRVDAQPISVHHGAMPPDMEKAAFALKPGEVTEVFDLGQAMAFVKIVSHNPGDLKAVSPQIEKTLQKQKIDSAMDALKKKTDVWMDDAYFAAPSQAEPRGSIKPEGGVTIPVHPKIVSP
jgi:peptidyl-prolyl cis-trans isomerase C